MATQAEIAQQYQSLFGRAPDLEGAAYWASTGLTGQALQSAMLGGAAQEDLKSAIQIAINNGVSGADIGKALIQAGVSQDKVMSATGFDANTVNQAYTAGQGLLTGAATPTAATTPAYDVSKTVEFRNAGAGGQYGYVDGLPVLKASIADSVIDAHNGYVSGDAAGRSDNAMGWDTGSVNGVLTKGAGVFGIQYNPAYTDWESGNTSAASYSGDMDAAAQALNLNVAGMTDDQKYAAINNAAKDLYLVSGKTGYKAGGVGEQYNGVTQTAAIPGATTNHATVLYRKQGDALVPITQTAQYYNGEMELSPGSGLSDFISFAAPVAGIALMMTPGAQGLGASLLTGMGVAAPTAAASLAATGALVGAGTGALTGGNVLKGAALGALGGYAAGGGFSDLGNTLKTTFADITGIPVADLNAQFAAQDALTMAQNGVGTAAIQQNLIASGLDSVTAATLANDAVMAGATVGSLTNAITGSPTYTNVAGMLSGGDAFATTQSVYDKLVAQGMSPTEAVQAINTTGGGLGLGTVGLDAAGKLTQATAGTTGNLLTGEPIVTATPTTTTPSTGLSTAASTAAKALTGGSTATDIATGLLGGAAGVGGALADKAALERYASELKASAAQYAPQMQFQPIGMTTRFGSTTTPQYDANGRLIGFGYTPAADIAAQRDRLLALSNQALPTTTNIQQATQDYYNQLQALQQPMDEQTLAAVRAKLQTSGRAGLGLGATTGTGGANALAATNPELAAYYNALAQRQAQQALTAQDVAQQRLNQQITTSGNLFTQAGALETAAQQPLTMGTQLGGLTTAGSTNAARAQLDAAALAARLKSQGAMGVNSAVAGGVSGLLSGTSGLGSVIGSGLSNLSNWYNTNQGINYGADLSALTGSGGFTGGDASQFANEWWM